MCVALCDIFAYYAVSHVQHVYDLHIDDDSGDDSGDVSGGAELQCVDLFISEYAEGSSNNKYLEIYNPTDVAVDLSAGYAYPSVSNAPSTEGQHEYWNTFDAGAIIGAGDVYVVCHGSIDGSIADFCDETHPYLSNGDDGYCLACGTEDDYVCLDGVGDFHGVRFMIC